MMFSCFSQRPDAPRRSGPPSESFFSGQLSRSRVAFWAGAACVVALLPATGWAVRSESVIQQSFTDFSAGELENLSLHRDGRLTLAPEVVEIGRLTDSVIWSAVSAPDGTVYVGAGNAGTVYRLGLDGAMEELFTTEEILTRAMAVDGEGRLYVGTSPDGKVYRHSGKDEDEVELVFDPRETYIWALLFSPEGDLFVATGENGRIYRFAAGSEAGSEGQVYFDSDESHISTLAWDQEGRLLAGSSPNGYVYRIAGPDDVAILFNSPDEEIRQVLAGDAGEIYVSTFVAAAGTGATQRGAAIAEAVAALAAADNSEGEGEASSAAASAAPPRRSGGGTTRLSTLYRVDADGFHEPYWGLVDTAIHSLIKLDDGSLLIGTGDQGRIFSSDAFQSWELRQTLPTGLRVSQLIQSSLNSDILAFSSSPARVYRLDFGLSGAGTFTSKVFDGSQVSRWGRFYTEAAGDGVATLVRTGNTEKPDRAWSPWRSIAPDGTGDGETVPGRYFQYRFDLSAPEAEVRRVRFFYRHANAAPVIQSLRAVASHVGLERYELPPQQAAVDLEKFVRESEARSGSPAEPRQQIRSYERPGMVTAVWQARDPNGDDLIYTLKLRPTGGERWEIIADDLRANFYSFNGNGRADGEYQLKVIASDRLSNRPSEARSALRVSENFLIDNNAPEILIDQVMVEGGSATVRFRAADATSIIVAVDYSLNGGVASLLIPDDGIFDAREESFQIELGPLAAGHHSLLLQVVDEAGNRRVRSLALAIAPAE